MSTHQPTLEERAARLYEPLLGRLLRPLRDTVLALCPAHGRILDCGCGPGGLLRLLCAPGRSVTGRSVIGRSVTGVDVSALMLAQARRHAPQAGLVQADAGLLPFADGCFDAACVCLVLHALPAPVADAALREVRRVARRVILADYVLAERNLALPAVLLAHGVERCVGGDHYRNYRAFMRNGALEGLLYRHGAQPVERHDAFAGAGRVCVL